MITLCMVVSLMGVQPSVECMRMSKDMAAEATLSCIHDPMLDCTAHVLHWRNTVILTVRKWTK